MICYRKEKSCSESGCFKKKPSKCGGRFKVGQLLGGFCTRLILADKHLRRLLTSARSRAAYYHLDWWERGCHQNICSSWYLGQWTSKKKRVINFLFLGRVSLRLPFPVRMKECSASFFLLIGKILFLFLPASLISTEVQISSSFSCRLRVDKGTLARNKCVIKKQSAQDRKHGKGTCPICICYVGHSKFATALLIGFYCTKSHGSYSRKRSNFP